MTRGAHCTSAETISLSVTLPSHASMVTGLGEQRHGITWNDYRPGTLAPPTIFTVAARSNLSTAMLFSKDKFHYLAAAEGMNWIYGPAPPGRGPRRERASLEDRISTGLLEFGGGTPGGSTAERTSAVQIAREFARDWQAHPYQLTFLHFRETDVAGHAQGWMGAEYLQAVEEVDYALGIILSALEAAGTLGRTVVIVTADHGGSGRGHFDPQDPRRAEHVRIPWICAGPGVPPGLVIDRPVRTMDTAPTILALLGLPLPDGIDGVPVREVLTDAPAYRTTR
jgi:arylsulfatase A-like enzyme